MTPDSCYECGSKNVIQYGDDPRVCECQDCWALTFLAEWGLRPYEPPTPHFLHRPLGQAPNLRLYSSADIPSVHIDANAPISKDGIEIIRAIIAELSRELGLSVQIQEDQDPNMPTRLVAKLPASLEANQVQRFTVYLMRALRAKDISTNDVIKRRPMNLD